MGKEGPKASLTSRFDTWLISTGEKIVKVIETYLFSERNQHGENNPVISSRRISAEMKLESLSSDELLELLRQKIDGIIEQYGRKDKILRLGNVDELVKKYLQENVNLLNLTKVFSARRDLVLNFNESIATIQKFQDGVVIQNQQKEFLLETLQVSEVFLKSCLGRFILDLFNGEGNINIEDIFVLDQHRRQQVKHQLIQRMPDIQEKVEVVIGSMKSEEEFESEHPETMIFRNTTASNYGEMIDRASVVRSSSEQVELDRLKANREAAIVKLAEYALEIDGKP